MAFLDKHGNREDWLKWAIEFMRRGLWVGEAVEVHGPHGPNADLMWGEAEASEEGGDESTFEVSFTTVRGITGIHDVRGVRIQVKEPFAGIPERFPLRPEATLSRNARRWLKVARRVQAKLRDEAIATARQVRERREALARTMR
jgi:hypothetical protein